MEPYSVSEYKAELCEQWYCHQEKLSNLRYERSCIVIVLTIDLSYTVGTSPKYTGELAAGRYQLFSWAWSGLLTTPANLPYFDIGNLCWYSNASARALGLTLPVAMTDARVVLGGGTVGRSGWASGQGWDVSKAPSGGRTALIWAGQFPLICAC